MTKWRWGVRAAIAAGVLVAVIAGVVALRHAVGPDRGDPRAGDCVRATTGGLPDNRFDRATLAVADCTDRDAVYKVLGRIDQMSQGGPGVEGPSPEAAGRACRPYPRTTATYWHRDAGSGGGYLLCLAPNLRGT